MKINNSCIGCGNCILYCLQNAIVINRQNIAVINSKECIECGVCADANICQVNAFEKSTDETVKVLANGKEYCDCSNEKCERHGNCIECIKYHGETMLPRCKRNTE